MPQRQSQLPRRHQLHPHARIQAQQRQQRVDRAPVQQVTHQRDLQPTDTPQLLLDGVHVGQRLCRVLAHAIARVDDRHRRDPRRSLRRALFIVANRNRVRITAHDADGVGDGLALGRRRAVARILLRQNAAAQLLHRSLKAETRARARLIEDRRQNASAQRITQRAKLVIALHLVRGFEQSQQKLRVVELPRADNVPELLHRSRPWPRTPFRAARCTSPVPAE
jgi:hypothetical protein